LRECYRQERVLGKQVVLTRFVNDTQQAQLLGSCIRQSLINFAGFKRYFVVGIGYAKPEYRLTIRGGTA